MKIFDISPDKKSILYKFIYKYLNNHNNSIPSLIHKNINEYMCTNKKGYRVSSKLEEWSVMRKSSLEKYTDSTYSLSLYQLDRLDCMLHKWQRSSQVAIAKLKVSEKKQMIHYVSSNTQISTWTKNRNMYATNDTMLYLTDKQI